MTEIKTPMVPVSWGELIDKITILEIKSERLVDPEKQANVRRELTALRVASAEAGRLPAGGGNLMAELKAVNQSLWDIEDQIRESDAAGDFGPRFIELARAVYRNNDRRAKIKREINLLSGSELMEEKSYADHGDDD
jgi:hypothetical protein